MDPRPSLDEKHLGVVYYDCFKGRHLHVCADNAEAAISFNVEAYGLR